eukprot:TRINITY_DN65080_c0_g1_i1.p1 TRINITY_DN65080_c0_g1~~TRINITY_DN65080_c0_g1_i1.p1  ORF type:complete len:354 (+),score=82.82 TRINITY_DN65080_c0_g1_i1:119-1180(+)
MGAGAGALNGRSEKALDGSGSDGAGAVGQPPAISAAAAAEGGICWLLQAIDKEKSEKEWLAQKFEWLSARYDEKCLEVRHLQEEMDVVRSDLKMAMDVLHPLQAKRSTSATELLRGMQPAVVEKAQGDNASWGSRFSTGSPGFAPDAGATSSTQDISQVRSNLSTPTAMQLSPMQLSHSGSDGSISPTTGTLKERRGLKIGGLQVQDSHKKKLLDEAAHRAAEKEKEKREQEQQQAAVQSQMSLTRTPSSKFPLNTLHTHHEDEGDGAEDVEDAFKQTMIEPQSALLRRRAEDWSTKPSGPLSNAQPMVTAMKSSPVFGAIKHVKTDKVLSLEKEDPDCPCSPKRPGRKQGQF